jgi:hypothetical protein
MKKLEEMNIYEMVQHHFIDSGDAIPEVKEVSFGYNVRFDAPDSADILYIENIDVLLEWAKLHNLHITMTTVGRVSHDDVSTTTFHLQRVTE